MDIFSVWTERIGQTVQSQLQYNLRRCLVDGTGVTDPGTGTGSGTLYTAPLSGYTENSTALAPKTKLEKLYMASANDTTLDLHIVASGGTADSTNKVWAGTILAPVNNTNALSSVTLDFWMNAGDSLQVKALENGGTNVTSYFWVIGTEYF